MYAAGGPPIIVFLVYANIHKDTTRATIAFCNAVLNTCRFGFYYYLQTPSSTLSDHLFANYATVMLILNISSVLGLVTGNAMANYINQSLFMLIILTILFSGSILLATFHCNSVITTFVSVAGAAVYVSIMILRSLYPAAGVPDTKRSTGQMVMKYNRIPLEDEENGTTTGATDASEESPAFVELTVLDLSPTDQGLRIEQGDSE